MIYTSFLAISFFRHTMKLFILNKTINQLTSESEQNSHQSKRLRGVWEFTGAWGEVGRGGRYWQWWRRESALLAAVSFMSETEKDSQRKKLHERGTVRVKEKLLNHLKGFWGWHLHILRLSPFANIPRPQKTLSTSYLMLFSSLFLRQEVFERKIPLV